MPIFTPVESKSTAGRLFHAGIFILLTLGAVTMLYPLLLMVSGAFRSEIDENELGLIPAYLTDDDALYRKFLEYKYEQRIGELNAAHLSRDYAFSQIKPPAAINETAVRDLRTFIAEGKLPLHWQALGGSSGMLTIPKNLRTLRQRVQERFGGDVEAFAKETGTAITSWTQVTLPPPQWLSSRYDFESNALHAEYLKLLQASPPAERRLVTPTGTFLVQIAYPRYGTLERFNETLELSLKSFSEFRLPRHVPPQEQAAFRSVWLEYVGSELNPSFILTKGVEPATYQRFLSKRYGADIGTLNQVWGETVYAGFSGITLPRGEYLSGQQRRDYRAFLDTLPPESWELTGPEYAWVDWLRQHHENGEVLSQAYGESYPNIEYAWLPQAQLEYQYTREHAGQLRRQFAARNFVNVIDRSE
ncbi:MAG: hypothetical protein ACQKBW_11215, partial [Puniceicoccales bacterium]